MSIISSSSSSTHRLLPHLRFLSSSATSFPDLDTLSVSQAKFKLRYHPNPDKALAIFSSIFDRLYDPISTRYILDLVVRQLAEAQRFSDIENLIESHKSHPKFAQEPFFATLIHAYGRARMTDRAIQTFRDMDGLATPPRSVISFNALLTACYKAQQFNQVTELFSEITKNYEIAPDTASYGILIKSHCESGQPESAISLLNEMEEKGIEIGTFAYTHILDSLYKKGKVEDAEKLWNEMREKGCSPDVVAYNVKIMHAAHHQKPKEVLKLIDEMVSAGLKPDTISYNFLITCYCKNGQMDEAKKVYMGLQEKGCKPNVATFRTLVHFLCENGDFDMALEVFNASKKRHKIPKNKVSDLGNMGNLIRGLVKTSKSEEAKAVLEYVKKRFPESFMNGWKKVEMELGLTDEGKGSTQVAA
ncbi:pentatricopeptide repeat-containing protein, mitochondrial [Cinnamomum micranthum f. kanehirae]|uniref:Pentatricopeptide repeat-containing protein, mitochondrial n=1 Tax=Cinnamomum micranthum f. kanehirae TaxID=337451 RepID=A0A3S3P0I7_9MAGN|nr:pentatricopeptide repeat-containing protein, mitochondrial [Cinnamomum micranthum f. kanehirae]